ncbi:MAG: hypothetical protein ISS50_00390 [Anaerolineae bacterium]|nr:hypothetical protein [Anaerolineae bacterium]
MSLAGCYPLPNLVETMANLMEHATPPVRLTRRTLLEIIRRAPNQQAVLDNPNEFATVAVRIIKDKLGDQLVEGIQYEKTGEWYEMAQLEAEIPGWEGCLVPAEKSVYDHVVCDSEIERQFVEELERRDDVKLYLKLPAWFTVPTPIGEYNPGWAIVMEDRDEHGQPCGIDTILRGGPGLWGVFHRASLRANHSCIWCARPRARRASTNSAQTSAAKSSVVSDTSKTHWGWTTRSSHLPGNCRELL